ncbi:MAG: L-aspartate oxidase [Deltaproteobacteria bacterium]|nr:L-aspartate oxidase [Deltaproteobacteria bacterium]
MNKFDFLVIGGGIAGLTYALEVAQHGTVAILVKKGLEESSTSWAQGGVAAVTSADDNYELHIEDTKKAGAGLCRQSTVEIVVREGPDRVRELIDRGAHFDRAEGGSDYHLHQEGGHSRRRIFHAADQTGSEIQRTLLRAVNAHPNIKFFSPSSAIDIITTHKLGIDLNKKNRAIGAYVYLHAGKIEPFVAKSVLVATGGAGKVYLYTSNPDVATGDGIAMCYRAGCRVANMEFFQFHPTCLYHPQSKSFLITEAMRGEGAKLKRVNGEEFMHKYHELRELAPRDIVARAIDNEMKLHGEEHVLLDITHRDPEFVKSHFPMIYQRCMSFGFDITKAPIPVVPAAHYCCGGVVSDEHGLTDIDHLYVAGECAHTGLHGANRLASNSLLEGLVFGHRAAEHSIQSLKDATVECRVPAWDPGSATDSDENVVITQNWDEIRRFMWNYVGIVRSSKRLERALHRQMMIEKEINDYYWNFTITPDLLELRNLNLVAGLVVRCAMARKESRGLHYTIDFPRTSDEFLADTILDPAA